MEYSSFLDLISNYCICSVCMMKNLNLFPYNEKQIKNCFTEVLMVCIVHRQLTWPISVYAKDMLSGNVE